MKLVDLSLEIFEGMPVYPSHQRTVIYSVKDHKETSISNGPGTEWSSATCGILMSDHGPTHMDAQCHVDPDPNAMSIEQYPLDELYTEAICLDVSHIKGGAFITKPDLEEALQKAGLVIKEGDAVLIYTSHSVFYPEFETYLYNYPGLDGEATQWLYDMGARNVGIDGPSIDSSNQMKLKQYPAHIVCRHTHLKNIENMGNLGAVAGKRFHLAVFTLKLRGATGSPVRPVAFVNED
ncbi:MAG: putative cyclase [Bacillota bacterium]|nr:putative cyclase [Bacillota bacterium]